ncbi:NrdR family transcriptional regulator [Aureliella helgolandensis]|uniref:Transcriptional repressor NrdR-like N-terminal domain-containing protein n=1 Tax=Aureliella helgolandensis TaxID=2527968 RepID=A0A518GDN3_9BACT|nr:hypothetical protein Q31a_50340 [Aureliella helgolandensis]
MQDRQPPEAPAVTGLQCPSCGGNDLPVWYTRKRLNKTLRMRICSGCGRRLITYERID